ncbi:SgcJ/EcaC family oxidoreductase [Ekhidna sp.]|uniref:YybH family protein n=1 Tax=Ekhidna sp. TaxID=2608089 RepID=UPI0035170D4D
MQRIYSLIIITGLICLSCATEPHSKLVPEEIKNISETYVNGWLDGDSAKVLNLFAEDATIIPSGMEPILGIENIRDYWFPNDSSITTIHSYEVELLELKETDSMAYSLEKGVLNFTYTKDDFTMTRASTSHASTVYKKQTDGTWKIISRMWTQLK